MGPAGAQGVKKIFQIMVMWHIKSTGVMSRKECKENFHPSEVKRSNIIKF